MKLMIAIPSTGYMHYMFSQSLANLLKKLHHTADINCDVVFHGASMIHLGREELTNKAIDGEYDHVLWLDSDMVFDDDIVDKLYATMKEYDCDLVAGVFRSRHGGMTSCLFESLNPDIRIKEYPDKPFKIEGCGMACVLVKTSMLQRIWDANGHCFLPTAMHSEDIALCYRAKKLDMIMMANPDVKVGHMANGVLWPDKTFNYI